MPNVVTVRFAEPQARVERAAAAEGDLDAPEASVAAGDQRPGSSHVSRTRMGSAAAAAGHSPAVAVISISRSVCTSAPAELTAAPAMMVSVASSVPVWTRPSRSSSEADELSSSWLA